MHSEVARVILGFRHSETDRLRREKIAARELRELAEEHVSRARRTRNENENAPPKKSRSPLIDGEPK